MEALSILEKKVSDLVELIKKLKEENAKLAEENLLLQEKIEALETSMLQGKEDDQQEKELAKAAIDSLIKSIDCLVESEK